MLKPGDEVCMLTCNKDLIFGTLEYLRDSGPRNGTGESVNGSAPNQKKFWKVKWTHDPSRTEVAEYEESQLMATDRALYKGCKVKMMTVGRDGGMLAKTGICSSVFQKADLRILGTNTVIPKVNIDEFSHLKEYKQKSVVHYKGWLGVITAVHRQVLVQSTDGSCCDTPFDLNSVLPSGPLNIETFWIAEQVDHFNRVTVPSRLNTPGNVGESNDGTSGENLNKFKRARRIGFIKDMIIGSVKVQWTDQIDQNYPDKPREEFKNQSHLQLQIIKEHVSGEESTFSFDVGNIGRYMIKSQTEYLRWDSWQRKFAKENLSAGVVDKLQTTFEYEQNRKSSYWRTYEDDSFNDVKTLANERIDIGKVVCVEIAHISTTADVVWEDNTFEIPRSSLDLEIIEDSIHNATDIPRPGDFVFSKQLPYKHDKTFSVVLKQEKDMTTGKSKLHVKVLDSIVPGKFLADAVLEGDLRLSAKRVVRHPVFQYFNESTTIVVVNEDRDSGNKIRIGNVLGTNLQGKVNVRFMEPTLSGQVYKEEWIWPQVCAIYSVKGFDLECVKSHVIDTEVTIPAETKLHRILDSLKIKVDAVFKNTSKSEENLHGALSDFCFIFSSLESLVNRIEMEIVPTKYRELETYLARPIGVELGCRPPYLKGNAELSNLIAVAVQDLISQGERILGNLQSHYNDDPMSVDCAEVATNSGHEDQLAEMFSKTVLFQDYHPEGHNFAKSTKYNPEHHRSFVKVVKEELGRLQMMCSTEHQSDMGILARAFSDRMDLLSILMRGQEGTPYDNSLYIFDAFLPPSYPNVPPKFHFNAFKAGRLNPNLYAEGMVCVSLLGTWRGEERERWTKDSNIVQILISIQGLILVKEPYHNEPGYEVEKFSTADARKKCHTYNTQLIPLVVQMMINQLDFPMDPWKEEIYLFYKNQIPIFLTRWRKWLSAKTETDLGDLKPGFAIFPFAPNFASTMSTLLAKLEEKWTTKLMNLQ